MDNFDLYISKSYIVHYSQDLIYDFNQKIYQKSDISYNLNFVDTYDTNTWYNFAALDWYQFTTDNYYYFGPGDIKKYILKKINCNITLRKNIDYEYTL